MTSSSIHPSICFHISGPRLQAQQSQQGHPDLSLPRHFLQLFWEDSKVFPDQVSGIIIPAFPGSFQHSPPRGTCPEHLLREMSGGHLILKPNPPLLACLDVEEQWLYFKLLLGDRAQGPLCYPEEETHFSHLYPIFCSLSHDPQFMTID